MIRLRCCLCLLVVLALFTEARAQDAYREAFKNSYRYEQAQNYADAIKALLSLNDGNGYLVNLRLGWLYYLSGNHANARQHYLAAIQAAPKAIEPRLGYMLPLLAQARYDEVEATARQVLTMNPSNYYASLRLAVALRMQSKFPQAQEVCSSMSELYPSDVSFLVELGLNHVGQKNRDAAQKVFLQVQTLDPENLTAKQQLNPQPIPPRTKGL